jgi:IS1 family transposase
MSHKAALSAIPNVVKILSPKTIPFKEQVAVVDVAPKPHGHLATFNLLIKNLMEKRRVSDDHRVKCEGSGGKVFWERHLIPSFWLRLITSKTNFSSYVTEINYGGRGSRISDCIAQFICIQVDGIGGLNMDSRPLLDDGHFTGLLHLNQLVLHENSLFLDSPQGFYGGDDTNNCRKNQQSCKEQGQAVRTIPRYRHGGQFGDAHWLGFVMGGYIGTILFFGWGLWVTLDGKRWGWGLMLIGVSLDILATTSAGIGCLPWDWRTCLHEHQERNQGQVLHRPPSVGVMVLGQNAKPFIHDPVPEICVAIRSKSIPECNAESNVGTLASISQILPVDITQTAEKGNVNNYGISVGREREPLSNLGVVRFVREIHNGRRNREHLDPTLIIAFICRGWPFVHKGQLYSGSFLIHEIGKGIPVWRSGEHWPLRFYESSGVLFHRFGGLSGFFGLNPYRISSYGTDENESPIGPFGGCLGFWRFFIGAICFCGMARIVYKCDGRLWTVLAISLEIAAGFLWFTGRHNCHVENDGDKQYFHGGQIVPQKYLTRNNYWGTVIRMANVLNTDKQIAIIGALAEGSSIRSIERITGVHRDTIMRLGVKVGNGCASVMDSTMRNLPCNRLEMDEIWGFVGKKEKNVRVGEDAVGSVWTFCAIDAETKLVPAFKVGDRSIATAKAFVHDVANRMAHRVQISTDGLNAYVSAIESAFGGEVDYAQIIKTYGHEETTNNRRYSAPDFVSSERSFTLAILTLA